MDISKIRIIRNNSFMRDNWDLLIVLIIYSVLAVIFLSQYLYSVGGDTISYIDIAKAYSVGGVFEAINGYWSPLFSWLLVPFLFFGSTPLYYVFVVKLVSVIIGFFTIISLRQLYNKFEMDKLTRRVFLFSLVPAILYFSLKINTPDLLVVLLLVYYLSIIFDPKYSSKLSFGILCGFIGALAYLTKSYLFFFFLVHFILFNIIFIWKNRTKGGRKNVLTNLMLGLLVFFLISGLWIGTISNKYGRFTISTAGEYNQAIMGPNYMGHHPLYSSGLIEPPGKYTVSIWDEPSFTKLNHWNPLSSAYSLKYEFRLIENNIVTLFYIFESFFVLSILIIVAAIISLIKLKSDKLSKERILYLLITIFIYITGYMLITVEWRYFWFIFILVMFTAFYLVNILYKNKMIKHSIRNILLIILAFSFIIQPTIELMMFPGDGEYVLSQALQTEYGIHGNLASNDNWGEMNALAYFLNAKYFGLTTKTTNSTLTEKELKNSHIDYYFVWNNDKLVLADYREITGGKLKNLHIYAKI